MNNAENIVESGSLPDNWIHEANRISKIVIDAFSYLETVKGQEFPATRFARDDDNNVIMDEDGTPQIVTLVEDGETVMEPHPLEFREYYHGLHAYRYEECPDLSVVAIYANDPTGEIKMKAFSNIEVASLWSPRDERV